MKPLYYAFAVVAAHLLAHAAYAEPAKGIILEQVKPGSMIVRKADHAAATPAVPAKKLKAKNTAEVKEVEGETATPAVPVVGTTPLSGLSDDPSTLQREKALIGR